MKAELPSSQNMAKKLIMDVTKLVVECSNVCVRVIVVEHNDVRMWLKVITIAELTDTDGACTSPEKLDRRWRNDSTHLWSNIPKPSKKMFEIFRLYVPLQFKTPKKRPFGDPRHGFQK